MFPKQKFLRIVAFGALGMVAIGAVGYMLDNKGDFGGSVASEQRSSSRDGDDGSTSGGGADVSGASGGG